MCGSRALQGFACCASAHLIQRICGSLRLQAVRVAEFKADTSAAACRASRSRCCEIRLGACKKRENRFFPGPGFVTWLPGISTCRIRRKASSDSSFCQLHLQRSELLCRHWELQLAPASQQKGLRLSSEHLKGHGFATPMNVVSGRLEDVAICTIGAYHCELVAPSEG